MSAGEIVAKILRARGIDEAEFEDFLNPSIDGLARPEELPGVEAAADAVLAAMAAGRKVVVFGDYDCDGVCATAILVKALGALGADVEPFLPNRLTEGYGMSDASVARLLAEHPGVGLVVTVDNGINSIDQIAALRSRGVDVVVTDHHLPTRLPGKDGAPGEVVLPDATALVNPKVAAPAHL
ncbi:MAG: DHH family phosphoesterase, partial [Kiritimatiellae bacterium]|nr:DHH family phosphoesterase [Kiritimatiellia bacterium]